MQFSHKNRLSWGHLLTYNFIFRMFGFMRNRECQSQCEINSTYRLHYCGTCKTMGTLYGQKTRPLLNFDTVFLSELLAILGNEQQNHWHDSYQAKSCFQLPKNQIDMPFSLQFSATVNVLLAALKVEDNRQDGATFRMKIAQKMYGTSFQKAEKQMQNWGLDTNLLWQEMEKQAKIEANFDKNTDFAAPTAKMTALIFEKGAEVMGNIPAKSVLYDFGKAFGTLIYWLDALEDYEKDLKNGQFNAIQAQYSLKTPELSNYYRKLVLRFLGEKEKEIHAIFHQMPISAEKITTFCQRFSLNLAAKLATNPTTENAFTFEWQAIQHVWQSRKEQALLFAKERIAIADSWQHQVQLNAWLLAAFIAPNLPQHLPTQQTEKHSLTFWAIFTAFIGALFLGKKAAKTCKHGKHKSYIKRIINLPFGRKKDACGDCVGECCTECCSECCESCCESCCDSFCDSLCESNPTLGMIGTILVLALLLAIIIIAIVVLV